jgi:hypothetical protein
MKRSLALLIVLGQAVSAAAESRPEPPQMSPLHREIVARACLDCHSAEQPEGGMRLDNMPLALDSIEAAERWQRVLNELNAGTMPPSDAPQLVADEKITLLDELSTSLAAARRLLADAGPRVPLRRLNRREYRNTILSLLGVEVDVRPLPSDDVADGFDTAGGALFMSSEQVLLYQQLGREAIDAAFEHVRGLANPQKILIEAERKTEEIIKQLADTVDWRRRNKSWMSAVDAAAAQPRYAERVKELKAEAGSKWWEFYWHWDEFEGAPSPQSYGFKDALDAYHGDRLWETIITQGAHYLSLPDVKTGAYLGLFSSVRSVSQTVRIASHWPQGIYRLTIRAGATDAAPPERRFIEVLGASPVPNFAHSHISAHHVAGTVKEPQEIQVFLPKTKTSPNTLLVMENRVNEGSGRDFYNAEFARNGVGPDYAIWIDWIELEGPVVTPDTENAVARVRAILDELARFDRPASDATVDDTATEAAAIRRVVERFARDAFRGQPPTGKFLDKLVGLYEARRGAGDPVVEAIKEPLAVVLASPRFLYLYEPSPDDAPRPLTDHELATRLASFLWSGPPDEALVALAASGRLHDPAVLTAETDRMLADPRARQFATAFGNQWLHLARLDFFQFSPKRFPHFDVSTKESARREVTESFLNLLTSGGSLSRLLASDSVCVDALLASYYGLAGVSGDAFQEVPLPIGSPRGGLLGMAAIMAMGSDGNDSSAVERGAWVLRKLLNDPPPPAPPNVPELKRISKGMTARERLRMHQEEPQCAQCHRKIDPIGFGLENFDAVGQWRTEDPQPGLAPEKKKIDPAGAFHNGPAFKDFHELRHLIAAQPERFARGYAAALVAYAMGRPISFADEELVEEMVRHAAGVDYRAADFIHTLVTSKTFHTK